MLASVAARLGPPDGEPVPLGGGITNRNYRWGDYVVRIPGANTEQLGIDRAGEVAAARLAHRLGLGPEVVMDEPLVTRFVDGRPLEEAELRARCTEIEALLARLHDCGETLPTRFDACAIVREYARITRPPDAHVHLLEQLVEDAYESVPCHNDLMAGNFLVEADGRLVLLDWEYAGMGDRRFDLANLAMNAGLDTPHATQLVHSLLREAMWGVVQSSASDLDFDFAAYAEEHFARLA